MSETTGNDPISSGESENDSPTLGAPSVRTLKGNRTKKFNKLKKLIALIEELNSSDIIRLKEQLEELEVAYDKFFKAHQALLAQIDDQEQKDALEPVVKEGSELFEECKRVLKTKLAPLKEPSSKNSEQNRNVAYENIKNYLNMTTTPGFQLKSISELQSDLVLAAVEWVKLDEAHRELIQQSPTDEKILNEFFTKARGDYFKFQFKITSQLKVLNEQQLDPIEILSEISYSKVVQQKTSNGNGTKTPGVNLPAAVDDILPIPIPTDPPTISTTQLGVNFKLEPIKIPTFDGKKENWVLFRDQFLSLIHTNNQLSDALKMHQLYTHLSDNALRAIKGITPAGSNYHRAWNVLNERFNNNTMLINHHFKRFFNLPILTRDEPSKLTMLVDGTNELINSLPGLNEPMKNWDSMLSFCIFNKLDKTTQESWKNHVRYRDQPSLTEFLEFIDSRAQSSETANSSLLLPGSSKPTPKPDFKKQQKRNVFHITVNRCVVCSESHPLFRCSKFRSLPVSKRIQRAKDAKVCLKCLTIHKPAEECKFDKCPVCSKPHNRLLCFEDENRRNSTIQSESNNQTESSPSKQINHLISDSEQTALLGTVSFKVINTISDQATMRAMCDTGSQINLITDTAVRQLKLPKVSTRIRLSGVGGHLAGRSTGMVTLRFTSLYNSEIFTGNFYVVQTITQPIPLKKVDSDWIINQKLNLADPDFDTPGNVDVLLGVSCYAGILLPGIRKFGSTLIAQQSKLGWIMFGTLSEQIPSKKRTFISAVTTEDSVDKTLNSLQKFFTVEETIDLTLPPKKRFKPQEQKECEQFFESTHYRTSNGRYGVCLPFKLNVPKLGKSKEIAKRQFYALEKRLNKRPEIKKQYIEFMREYLNLGHMSLAKSNDEEGYYTPHHYVISSKKFRTVFNASSQCENGLSLNDIQLIGEKLQTDLSVLLLQFRRHKIALTADVSKMYRQIEVHPNDRKYQKIFWRESEHEPLLTYELNTITYGQAAAPHCAVRSLQQCAKDHAEKFPIGAENALNYFYVDDFLGGGDTIEETMNIKTELINLLKCGGFELSKWCSNKWAILNSPDAKQDLYAGILLDDHEMQSVLGLHWFPLGDVFIFKVESIPKREKWTKRQLLSEVGRIYDPNGFLAPLTIIAKMIIQTIWQDGGEWDTPIADHISKNWHEFIDGLEVLSKFKIPRWLGMNKTTKSQLHGFCDASQNAYAAVVYIRTVQPSGEIITRLVQAKTRVAPLKKPLTIPRLELCGALLLAKLMKTIIDAFGDQISSAHYWCDSQVVLHWIQKHPSKLKVYAANRVNEIQELTKISEWNYVPTADNPADVASRGNTYDYLTNSKWISGPSWLKEATRNWPSWKFQLSEEQEGLLFDELKPFKISNEEEPSYLVHVLTSKTAPFQITKDQVSFDVFEAYENFDKIINVIAWVKRATKLFKDRKNQAHHPIFNQTLTPFERNNAICTAAKWVQYKYLKQELKSIYNDNPNSRERAYRKLPLFIDNEGLLRLSGRIRNQELSFDFKNPMILPPEAIFTKKLFRKAHEVTLHGGAQQMLQYLRQNFWIPRARQLCASTIASCTICKRHDFTSSEQKMAQLPTTRTSPGKPFERTGVDYCGPVFLKPGVGRSNVTLKAYICVFVCFITRAVHLELVSDLTTSAFLSALRRFMARRGRVDEMYSDHGTNFVGAVNEIKRLKNHLEQLSHYPFATEFNLKWTFTTERASHQGGLFEAAVKSAKRHLIRTLGEQRLNFEEYGTVLAQVEACLNSRPMSKISDDANDYRALTPGHFLVGEQLNSIPDENDYKAIPLNRLSRWQLLQRIVQDFWKRWHDEYLYSLIHSPKWTQVRRNFQVNDLVIIKEDNLPPTKWKLGRIIQILTGGDGLVRSVKLKTATGYLNRPIVKLALLVENESGSNTPEDEVPSTSSGGECSK